MLGFGKKKREPALLSSDEAMKYCEQRVEELKRTNTGFIGSVTCPGCGKFIGMTPCEYCGREVGVEGLNVVGEGRFYYCKTCNRKFDTEKDYKEHHFKQGHA